MTVVKSLQFDEVMNIIIVSSIKNSLLFQENLFAFGIITSANRLFASTNFAFTKSFEYALNSAVSFVFPVRMCLSMTLFVASSTGQLTYHASSKHVSSKSLDHGCSGRNK